jgi:class 3 adenylate cyclase/tetratricopeptide (TPR) repeat protein
VTVCPNCGKENVEDAVFCAYCGTSLSTTPPSEERRFLTILFADLVGFTAESDEADPEDVRARLVPYHQRVREEVEAFDGTVEKLIGDGVMAVFGAPTAHEDDPERAVRVALRIQTAVDELNEEHEGLDLSVRIGVNTGEAVVTTGGQGERIVGDVVNTASRLESIAPPGGVVVGEATHRATELLIDYQDMDPVEVKGKAKLLSVWQAIEPRGRFGIDAAVRAPTPFLGRDSEMNVLTETFRRVIDDESLQLVTIAAAPGVGKSRLVNEFFLWIDDQPEIVWWRQGRCLPLGEGITFWALGEIVKGQAGILESDNPEVAEEKLATALEALTADPSDRDWLAGQLSPLVGAESGGEGGDRTEAFTAWRRFLEDLAAVRPLIMIVEDLHWADGALVEFLEDLLVWSADSPIMVICTARPELYEAHPGWGGGQRNSATISLAPLSDEHIARLLAALLGQTVLPAETQQALLDRAGGIPLYAEEFVRMLNDRGMLHGRGELDADSQEAIPVPETVQALIGSRLDVLSDVKNRAIEDASVVGKVFWEGALNALGDSDDVRGALRQLVAREWIRPVRNSSVEGEQEYAFWHALTRDVAYGRIPRAAKAQKHQTMAEWIEATAGERASDHAELIAHHYTSALEIAEAAGESDTEQLRTEVVRALTMAGDRAMRLDATRAFHYYQRALDLMSDGDLSRPIVMIKTGEAMVDAGAGRPLELYEQAAELALARGDRVTAGHALMLVHLSNWFASGIGAGTEHLDRAIDFLEAESASEQLSEAYLTRAGNFMMRGDINEQLAWSQKGIDLAEELELEDIRSRGLSIRGMARYHLGDVDAGMEDLRESLAIAIAESSTAYRLLTSHTNLAENTWMDAGPVAGLEIYGRGIAMVEARGGDASWPRAETMWVNFDLGDWGALLNTADHLLKQWASESVQYVPWAKSYQALVHVWRGETAEAAALQSEYLSTLREIGDLQLFTPALVIAARTEFAQGNGDKAAQLLDEFIEVTRGKSPVYRGWLVNDAVRLLVAVGSAPEAESLAADSDAPGRRNKIGVATAQAGLAEASGDYERALGQYEVVAADWADYGYRLEHALALYGAGRSLAALGRANEANEQLAAAREILVELGAQPTIDEIDGVADQTAGRSP